MHVCANAYAHVDTHVHIFIHVSVHMLNTHLYAHRRVPTAQRPAYWARAECACRTAKTYWLFGQKKVPPIGCSSRDGISLKAEG